MANLLTSKKKNQSKYKDHDPATDTSDALAIEKHIKQYPAESQKQSCTCLE
jgi:hypothetical protein